MSPAQRQITEFICKGLSNKEIGEQMGLSEQGVKYHVTMIFRALGVKRRYHVEGALKRKGLGQENSSSQGL